MSNFGLSESNIKIILEILRKYQLIEKVVISLLFGGNTKILPVLSNSTFIKTLNAVGISSASRFQIAHEN